MSDATTTAPHRPCIIIPCYNHGRELGAFLPHVSGYGVPVIVVDDGSAAEEAAAAREAAEAHGAVYLRQEVNLGKWGALQNGVAYAAEQGYTHALQCDADGQHDAGMIPEFIRMSGQMPEAYICGMPVYGDDVPKKRLKGRRISNFFAWLETAGACKIDTMCGFRLYPLHALGSILRSRKIMPGMSGDIEVLVHIFWSGCRMISLPVRVRYPEDGRSNFRMLRDNVLISWSHTKLCTAALLHPWRLWRAHKTR